MDRTEVLLGALRTEAAFHGASQLALAQVETAAETVPISPSELPALIAQLQARTPPAVELLWGGGGLRVLPPAQPQTGGGDTFNLNMPNATLGPGAAFALKGNATGGSVKGMNSDAALGVLGNLAKNLAALHPSLSGEAAATAAQAERTLRERPASDASDAAKKSWASKMGSAFSAFLKAAPEAEAWIKMGEEAAKLLS